MAVLLAAAAASQSGRENVRAPTALASSSLTDGNGSSERTVRILCDATSLLMLSRSRTRACVSCGRADSIVYYNAELRKTVRQIPGYHAQQDAGSTAMQQASTPVKNTTVAPTIPQSDNLTEQEHFVPIDFDKAMSIEGHESQVVHVRSCLQHYVCKRAQCVC